MHSITHPMIISRRINTSLSHDLNHFWSRLLRFATALCSVCLLFVSCLFALRSVLRRRFDRGGSGVGVLCVFLVRFFLTRSHLNSSRSPQSNRTLHSTPP